MWLWVGDGSLCGCELVERGVAVGGWWVMVWQMMHAQQTKNNVILMLYKRCINVV